MLIPLKNKRGDFSIIIFVLMVFVLSTATLFIFITNSNSIEVSITDARVVEGVYLRENLVNFYVREAAEAAVVNTFAGDLKSEVEDNFKENFKGEFAKYPFEESYLIDLKELVSEGDFSVSLNGEVFEVRISKLNIEGKQGNIDLDYFPKILVEVNQVK